MTQPHPPLHPTLERLLAPDIFAQVTGTAWDGAHLRREAIDGGLSGAHIERLMVDPAADERGIVAAGSARSTAYILKHLDPATNWLMRASGDQACREIQFTQSLLWTRLPREIWAPILGCAYTAARSGVLLMPDLTAQLYPAIGSYGPVDTAALGRMVDGLAALHATFWESAELGGADWLASPSDALFAITPARLAATLAETPYADESYGAQALARWRQLPHLIDHEDADALQRVMERPERILAALRAAPKTLAHGDAWLANLGEHQGRLILLDWALCTAGPAPFDTLWLAHTWRAADPDDTLAYHRRALTNRGVLAVRDDATWDLLGDLAWVRTTLMGLEALVDDVLRPESPVPHPEALDRLRYWCRRTTHILERRGW